MSDDRERDAFRRHESPGLELGNTKAPSPLQSPSPTRRHRPFRRVAPKLSRSWAGMAGVLVAAMLLLVAVFADLIASDLPLACKIHGQLYLLPNLTRPAVLESMDRTRLAKEATFSISPLVATGPSRADAPALLPPLSKGHPFGTDRVGHDVFARVIHATRSYLVFAMVAVLASVALGAFLGGLGGVFGGLADALVGRLIETISAFPPLVLVIGVQAAVPRPTLATLFCAIAITRFPEVARLVRADVLQVTTRDYVLAARALGASPFRILRKHVEPNVRGPIVVIAAVGISAVVLTEASLDFLHVGVPASSASWGETMSQFREAPHAWWLLFFPGVLLVATVVGNNMVGEAFREAFDPRSR